ncbi:hypothetical protein ACJJTC_018536 [Scirpophaga incertulas]
MDKPGPSKKRELRKQKMLSLKRELIGQQAMFTKPIQDSEAATEVSYEISRMIAKRSRPFNDGDFVKECIEIAAKKMCPEAAKKFEKIQLNRITIQRRIMSLSALDESTDITSTAQLLIFIRGVSQDFEVLEELLGMCSLKAKDGGEINEIDSLFLGSTKVKFVNTIYDWSITLGVYDFPLQVKVDTGAQANILSYDILDKLRSYDANDSLEVDLDSGEIEAQINYILNNINASPSQINNIKELTSRDDELILIRKYIIEGWPSHRNLLPETVRKYWKAMHEGKDMYMVMLEFRNTPISHDIPSPAQIFFNRKLRGILPLFSDNVYYKINKDVKSNLEKRQYQSNVSYDRNKRDLRPLIRGEKVLFKIGKQWRKGEIVFQLGARTYKIISNGAYFIRNRIFIKSFTSVPFYIPDDIEKSCDVNEPPPVEIKSNPVLHRNSEGCIVTSSGRVSRPPDRFGYSVR